MYCTDAQMDLNFRKILKSVGENMMARDINSLKFLCQDYIPAGKLENTRKATDIFQELEHKGYLGPGENLYFLAELLQRIHRVDLIKKLGLGKPRDVQKKIEKEGRLGPQFSQFRLLLLSLCDNMTTEDLETIKYFCQPFISKGTMDKLNDAPSLLSYLEQTDRIGDDDVDFLVEMVECIGNSELLNKVNNYKANIGSSSSSSEVETKLYQPMQGQHRMVPSGRGIHETPQYKPPVCPETALMPPSAFMTGTYPQPQAGHNYQVHQQATTFHHPATQTSRYIGAIPAVPDARAATPYRREARGQEGVVEQPPNLTSAHQHAPEHQNENEVAVTERTSRQPRQPQENMTASQQRILAKKKKVPTATLR